MMSHSRWWYSCNTSNALPLPFFPFSNKVWTLCVAIRSSLPLLVVRSRLLLLCCRRLCPKVLLLAFLLLVSLLLHFLFLFFPAQKLDIQLFLSCLEACSPNFFTRGASGIPTPRRPTLRELGRRLVHTTSLPPACCFPWSQARLHGLAVGTNGLAKGFNLQSVTNVLLAGGCMTATPVRKQKTAAPPHSGHLVATASHEVKVRFPTLAGSQPGRRVFCVCLKLVDCQVGQKAPAVTE